MAENTTTGSDGKSYTMIGVDRRTLTMWLATLPETRVRAELRDELVAYQREAADALDAYFHEGAAANPRTEFTEFDIARERLRVLAAAADTGLLHRDHLAARAELIVSRTLGEVPQIPAQSKPLYVDDYMRSRGMSAKLIKQYSGQFGKDSKKAYIAAHGTEPSQIDVLVNGKTRQNYAYTASDEPVLNAAYELMKARHPELNLS